jgi:hypothetical protein
MNSMVLLVHANFQHRSSNKGVGGLKRDGAERNASRRMQATSKHTQAKIHLPNRPNVHTRPKPQPLLSYEPLKVSLAQNTNVWHVLCLLDALEQAQNNNKESYPLLALHGAHEHFSVLNTHDRHS